MSASRYVFHMCAWCLQRPKEGIRSFGTRAINDCESQCGCCYELNPDQLILLALISRHFSALHLIMNSNYTGQRRK